MKKRKRRRKRKKEKMKKRKKTRRQKGKREKEKIQIDRKEIANYYNKTRLDILQGQALIRVVKKLLTRGVS